MLNDDCCLFGFVAIGNAKDIQTTIVVWSSPTLNRSVSRVPVPASKFSGRPRRHLNHKPWRIRIIFREFLRGAIRGAAARERLLHPSAARRMQRRIRHRLVRAYELRFGHDAFVDKFAVAKVAPLPRSNWLPGGYAWWRERIFDLHPARWGGSE